MRWVRECCRARARAQRISAPGSPRSSRSRDSTRSSRTRCRRPPRRPCDRPGCRERDLTHLEFVTIDPPGAMDLDQALHLEADGDGYVVHYAIADVMAFLEPGDPVDEEAHRRGESLYAPDSKIPLHPKVLSEAAASLLPDQVRPAFVWTIRLDATGMVGEATVERALVRSRKQLDYAGVQRRDRPCPGRVHALGAQDGRRAADREGGGARRDLAADARPGGRRRRRSVAPGVPRDAARRVVERPDLADDRLRRRRRS